MGKVKNREFWESATLNNATFRQYYNRLTELSISMFEWQNLPDTVDERFLELTLFAQGQAVFFEDEALGYLALTNILGGQHNIYNIPTQRRAYAVNGYQRNLNEKDSVIIFNNLIHTNARLDVEMFARRLYNLDRIIDVNANAQKTPILLKGAETEMLTLKNAYMKYDGNAPVMAVSDKFDTNSISVLQTNAPYVADKIMQLKTQVWNEALTYLGISNINTVKKERLITDEVQRNQGGVMASRYSRLEARRQACKQINKMFGLDVWVDYREDYRIFTDEDVAPEEAEEVEVYE